MTGILSWMGEVTELGIVVRIEQVSNVLPVGSFQRSHSPANANNPRHSLRGNNVACSCPFSATRKTRLPE
jgi:hypothetical protein